MDKHNGETCIFTAEWNGNWKSTITERERELLLRPRHTLAWHVLRHWGFSGNNPTLVANWQHLHPGLTGNAGGKKNGEEREGVLSSFCSTLHCSSLTYPLMRTLQGNGNVFEKGECPLERCMWWGREWWMGGRRHKNSSWTGRELYCLLLAQLVNINLMVYWFSPFSSYFLNFDTHNIT